MSQYLPPSQPGTHILLLDQFTAAVFVSSAPILHSGQYYLHPCSHKTFSHQHWDLLLTQHAAPSSRAWGEVQSACLCHVHALTLTSDHDHPLRCHEAVTSVTPHDTPLTSVTLCLARCGVWTLTLCSMNLEELLQTTYDMIRTEKHVRNNYF